MSFFVNKVQDWEWPREKKVSSLWLKITRAPFVHLSSIDFPSGTRRFRFSFELMNDNKDSSYLGHVSPECFHVIIKNKTIKSFSLSCGSDFNSRLDTLPPPGFRSDPWKYETRENQPRPKDPVFKRCGRKQREKKKVQPTCRVFYLLFCVSS